MKDSMQKQGYLNDDYRLFDLSDEVLKKTEYHYHEFYKIIFFLNGTVTYMIEGNTYHLEPMDILFVGHHEMHRLEQSLPSAYKRMILWINPDMFMSSALLPYNLAACFHQSGNRHLLRLPKQNQDRLLSLFHELYECREDTSTASTLYAHTIFLQIMILLNRWQTNARPIHEIKRNEPPVAIRQAIDYINNHLCESLSINEIAKALYLSPSYLMHLFKQVTGTSLRSYISRKRMAYAVLLLKEGLPVTVVAVKSGYHDYSTFLRNFKAIYHCTPGDYLNNQNAFINTEKMTAIT